MPTADRAPVRVIVVEDEPAARARIVALARAVPNVTVVAECGDGAAAVEAVTNLRPDLLLLDIQLPELDGFEVIEAIAPDVLPPVVFITAHDEYAVRAFDAHAADYLLKPFSAVRFTRAFGRALERIGRAGGDRAVAAAASQDKPITRFVVRSGRKLYFVGVNDVDWIDVADNYLRLHVGGRHHLVRQTVGQLVPRLDAERFLRINRGLVVNIDRIRSVEAEAPGVYGLTMADGARLSSGRSYGAAVRALLR